MKKIAVLVALLLTVLMAQGAPVPGSEDAVKVMAPEFLGQMFTVIDSDRVSGDRATVKATIIDRVCVLSFVKDVTANARGWVVNDVKCKPVDAVAAAPKASSLSEYFTRQAAKSGMAETVVIAPGYPVMIDGSRAAVFGNQLCPRVDGMRVWFVGGDPNGGDGCVVIEKDTVSVPVRLAVRGKLLLETWAVERSQPDRRSLRRPGGELVVPVQ